MMINSIANYHKWFPNVRG